MKTETAVRAVCLTVVAVVAMLLTGSPWWAALALLLFADR